MMLPGATQFFLNRKSIREFSNLLEFVDADHHADSLFLSYSFRKIQNLFWGIVLRGNS